MSLERHLRATAIAAAPLWFALLAQGAEPFTLVVLPDTQNYVNSAANAPIFTAQTQWIRDHIEAGNERNIAFVSHVGDVVSTATTALQWERAVVSMSVLESMGGFVVPYGILPGNHDYAVTSDKGTGTAAYVANFGPKRFAAAPWYGGADPSGSNSVQRVTLGGREYLHLALEWRPTVNVPFRDPSPIAWAKEVIAAHPDTPVILSTHEYVDDVPPGRSSAGDALFNELVRSTDQIFIVLCGHFHSGNNPNSGEYHQVSINDYGKPVIEMLQDFQDYSNGGNGWLRLIRFDEPAGAVSVQTYSPWLDQFQTETVVEVGGYASEFSIALDFKSRFQFVAPPEPPVEIYDTIIFQQGANGYAGTLDKEIRSSGGDSANGQATTISVDGDDGSPGLQPNHGLFRFEQIIGTEPGQISRGAMIDQAVLELDAVDPGSGLRAYRMNVTWDESTRWIDLGGNGVTPGVECEAAPFFSIGADNSSANVPVGVISIGVTEVTRQWIDGTAENHGIALLPFTNGTNGIDIATSESTSPPRLIIRSLREGLELASWRQGVDGYGGAADTQISQSAPSTEFGSATSFTLDSDEPNGSGGENHVLIRFADVMPPKGEIVRASLFVTAFDSGSGGTLHRMLLPWSDDATWGASFGGDGVQADDLEARAQPDAILVGSTGEVEIDVTGSVREVLRRGATAIDWVMLPSGGNGWDLHSSEAAEALRPRLVIVVEAQVTCAGDLDGNGAVDGADLGALLGAWGGGESAADLDGNGVVDGADLGALLGAWGDCAAGG
jgi:hypothetical protein